MIKPIIVEMPPITEADSLADARHEAADRLRAWAGMGGAGYSRQVCADLCAWLEAGAQGPLPAMPRECAAPAARVDAQPIGYVSLATVEWIASPNRGRSAWTDTAIYKEDRSDIDASYVPIYATAPAAPAVPVPLTDEQIDAACLDIFMGDFEPGPYYDRAIARAIERALGITQQPGGER